MSAAFRSGAVMGFLLAGFGLLNLFLGIILFQLVRWGRRSWCGPLGAALVHEGAGLLSRAQGQPGAVGSIIGPILCFLCLSKLRLAYSSHGYVTAH